jgi:hypothetical protein
MLCRGILAADVNRTKQETSSRMRDVNPLNSLSLTEHDRIVGGGNEP